ncbi:MULTISPECIES: restriction endonuclease subunit S [unclassified Microcoleus]|uniref:restriction endonuclease subunit S n=1 Tax=unclassified Microcoleus TaxID=2642155 RepID=UPI002FD0288F
MKKKIPEGYKQTDVAVIPVEWDVTEIGDLNPFLTSGSRGWAKFYSDTGAPFIRITNMSRESIYLDLSDLKLVNLPSGMNEGMRSQLQEHDILISITADIGITCYVNTSVPKPAYINQHIALVRFAPHKINSHFVSYFLASENSQKLFRGSTDLGAKAGMSLLTVRKIMLALPPLSEQKAIAQALSDVDAAIAELDRLITKKRNIKQGATQQLLTGKKRLPGFSGEWEEKKLGEILDYIKGFAFKSKDYCSDGVRIIRVSDTTYNSVKDENQIYIKNSKLCLYTNWQLQENDLVLSTVGSKPPMYDSMVGKVVFIKKKYAGCLLNQNAVIIRSKSNKDYKQRLIYYHLTTKRYLRYIEVIFRGNANQANITLADLLKFEIVLPPTKEEQQAIAQVLTDMDTEIEALEQKCDKYKAIKQGMMQELLTGRTRLV